MKHAKSFASMVAWKMYGLPYVWGGDDPIQGFDCSGLVIEILKSVGVLPDRGDWTANMLYQRFRNHEQDVPCQGCLVFWGTEERKTHVEYCISQDYTMGASGGGSHTMTRADAIKQNAYIKVRPISTRKGRMWFVDPFKQ